MNESNGPRGIVDRLLAANAALVYIFFYAPIVLLVVFSFNENDNVGIWTGASLRWYGEMFRDDAVMGALRNSLVVAFPRALSVPGEGSPRRPRLPPHHHP